MVGKREASNGLIFISSFCLCKTGTILPAGKKNARPEGR
jgi:hypothetical protein